MKKLGDAAKEGKRKMEFDVKNGDFIWCGKYQIIKVDDSQMGLFKMEYYRRLGLNSVDVSIVVSTSIRGRSFEYVKTYYLVI